jgi:Fe(3+) dicitrate transport protein
MGIESYFEIDFIKVFGFQNKHSLNWFNNFSYTNATYTRSKNEIIIGKAVELVPAYMLRTGINYGIKDFKFSYLFSSVGMQYSDANNTTTTVPNAITGIVPAYFVMDASLQYNHKWLSIQTGCNNLSDNKYFTRRAEGYPGPGIIPSEGRNFYLTVGIKI